MHILIIGAAGMVGRKLTAALVASGQVGGKPISNVSELLTSVAALKPGEAAPFRVQRRDESLQLTVTPGLRPRARPGQQQR